MKKFVFLGLVLAVGASMAFAASISVPWFIDNAPAGVDPGALAAGQQVTFITLLNTTNAALTCSIEYFSATGDPLGPVTNNTFSLSPNAATAFRPAIEDDPNESDAGILVPDRPRDVNTKANGSIKITYVKNEGDGPSVQGTSTLFSNGIGYQHLLGQ